jgi:hypothetical protein
MAKSKNIDEKTLGKIMIINALKLEESLADLLRCEARYLRKQIKKNMENHEEIYKINKIGRYLLFSITLIDDRIKTGLDLIEKDASKPDNKV